MTLRNLFIAIISSISLASCVSNDFNEIDSDIINEKNYQSLKKEIPLSFENILLSDIQTNNLSVYQLGQYQPASLGKMNAAIVAQADLTQNYFGIRTQQQEQENNNDEKETIISARLHLPFFSKTSQKVIENQQITTSYTIDSIYGDKTANFTLSVWQSNYLLNDISNNLQEKRVYKSSLDMSGRKGVDLAEIQNFTIDTLPVNQYAFDLPTTPDTDESQQIETVLSPRIIADLSTDFFQRNFLDQEGSEAFSSSENFKRYFKGIIIETSHFSKDFLALLDLSKAYIELVYSYESTVDGKTLTFHRRATFPLSGISVNTFAFSDETEATSDKIYLQGGRRIAKINAIPDTLIEQLKHEKALVNDATLTFEVENPENIEKLPLRLIVFQMENGGTLLDYSMDVTSSNGDSSSSKRVHSSLYDKNTATYTVKITHHLNNILRNQGENPNLGLAIASNINKITPIEFTGTSLNGKAPETIVLTPMGVILKGNVSLKISYSTPKR